MAKRARGEARWRWLGLALLWPLLLGAYGAPGPDPGDEARADVVLPPLEVVGESKEPQEVMEDDAAALRRRVAGDRLRESPQPSLVEALAREVPGIHVTSRGVSVHGIGPGASGAFRMRGLGGSPNTQVLVVLDGIPDYQGVFGHPLPDAYLADLLERVDVLPGGDSVRYGTNALGGVIRLTSRWREAPGLELGLRTAYGSFHTLLLQPTLLARVRDVDISAAAHLRRSDGHRPGAHGSLESGQVAVRLRLGDHGRLVLRGRLVHLTGADPGPVTHPHADHWFEALRGGLSATLDWQRGHHAIRAAGFASGGRHVLYDGFLGLDILAGGYLQHAWRPHRSWELLFGAAADHADGRVENRTEDERIPVQGTTTLSAYTEILYRPVARWTLTAGARGLYSPQYGPLLLYKAGTRLDLWSGASARARWSTGFRAPTLRERYLPYPVANADLKPEKAGSFDVGLEQRLGSNLSAELTFFLTRARDFIRTFGVWPSAEVINIDHIRFYGVEGLVRAQPIRPLTLYTAVTYLNVGRYTAQNPTLRLSGGVVLSWRGLVAELSALWVSGLHQSNYRRDPLADILRVDLNLRYVFERPALALSLSLQNLGDTRNAFVHGYPLPGFHAMAGLEFYLR